MTHYYFTLLIAALFSVQTTFSQCMTTGDFESPEWTTQSSGNWMMTTSDGDWEANSAYVNTGSVNGGSNKFGMNSTGDYLITPQYSNPATLQFWVRTSSDPDDWTLEIQYASSPTGPWTTHTTVDECSSCAIDNNYQQISANLNLTGNYYIRFYVSSRSAGSIYIDDITLSCGAACSSADDVTGATASAGLGQATISWVAPSCFEEFMIVAVENGSVSVNPSGDGSAYTDNNVFGSGTDVGSNEFDVYEGTTTSATITNLAGGQNYCFRIFTRTGTIWNNGVEVCVTPLDASSISYVNGTLVNSCGSSAEGTSEMVTIQVGAADLHWDDVSITFPNGGEYCNSCTQTWTTNSSYVNGFLEPDCPGEDLVYEVGVDGNTIPAGERLVIFTGSPPDYDYDFSSLCGSGPVYVLFADNTSTSGRFANSAGGDRTLSYTIAGYTSSVTYYSSTSNTGSDGDFVSYDISGSPTYMNQCTPKAIISLSASQIMLSAVKENETTRMSWVSTFDAASYAIQRSRDGVNWEEIAQVSDLSYTDREPLNGVNFYRIEELSEAAYHHHSNIEKVDFNSNGIVENLYPNPATDQVYVDVSTEAPYSLTLYTVAGQQVMQQYTIGTSQLDVSSLEQGLYLLQIQSEGKMEVRKLEVY